MNLGHSIPQPDLAELQKTFSSITLQQLDEKAALLERTDNKYVVNQQVLNQALDIWASHFNILEIDGKCSFLYDNCYFDDNHLTSFHQHRQGKRTRFKIRTRHYVDSNICFVEIKLKGARGRTIKRRMAYTPENTDTLNADALTFIMQSYSSLYGKPFTLELLPALKVRFQRITLVAIEGSERMTIDSQLQFSDGDRSFMLDPNIAIIETKTPGSYGLANKILSSLHQHPVSACSKYCVGQALLGNVERYNRFLKAMRKLSPTSARA